MKHKLSIAGLSIAQTWRQAALNHTARSINESRIFLMTAIRALNLAALLRLLVITVLSGLALTPATASNLSAVWRLNGNGYPGEVVVQQAAEGSLSGTIYGNPLSGFHAPGDRSVVWLRGAPTQPDQAFVGSLSPDGNTISGRMYGLTVSGGGVGPARNVFAFTALRGALTPPGHPGLPNAPAGPASVAGTLTLNANNYPGQLVLNQAADGSLSGSIYGDRLSGHYAPGSGSIALLRFTGTQPTQLYIGTATAQGLIGEFYALTPPAGASAQRMRFDWSAQMPQAAQAPAATTASEPFAANSGIAGGAILASINEPTAARCLARCQAMAGCTGFQFAGGTFGKPRQPKLPGASCTLFSGSTSLRPQNGLTACLMPCNGAGGAGGQVLRPLDPGRVADPGRLLPGRRLPGSTEPVAPPPPAYIGPSAPPKVVAAVALPIPQQPAQPQTPPQPAPPPVAGLGGFEVVVGPTATIAPLAISDTTASCPPNKAAISVGYRVRPINADPQYGVEIKAAMPEGNSGRVTIRNANVFVPIQAEAIVTCVNLHPGLRAVDNTVNADQSDKPDAVLVSCGNDRVVGGGFAGEMDAHQVASAPMLLFNLSDQSSAFGFVSASVKATPLPGSVRTSVRAICAPAGAVPDWEAVSGNPQDLGGRATATLTLQCPTGKRMLSAGVASGPWVRLDKQTPGYGPTPRLAYWSEGPQGGYRLALIKNSLEPQGTPLPSGHTLTGGAISAFVSNRDIAGNSVNALLAGACATVP